MRNHNRTNLADINQLLVKEKLKRKKRFLYIYIYRERERDLNYLLITSLMRGCGRLVFEDFSLEDFGGSASFASDPFDDTEGASGNLRISLVNRYQPAARSSVLQHIRVRMTTF